MQQKLRKVVIALAIFGLVAFLLNLIVDNPYTHRLIRTALNNAVKSETNLLVDFEAIKVSVVPPGLSLYGLHVAPSTSPNEPLISAAHAKVRLSIWSLIMGEPRLGLVYASDLTLVWPPPWNFPGFLKNPPAGPPSPSTPRWPPDFRLPVDQVTLQNAKVYVEVPMTDAVPLNREAFVMSLVGIDLDVELDSWTDVEAELEIQSVNAAIGASSMLEETQLQLAATLDGSRVTARRLKTKGERLNFDGTATVDLAGPKRRGRTVAGPLQKIDIQATGLVVGDMSLLGSFLDLADTRGPVQGDVSVTASVPMAGQGEATFRVEGQGRVKDAQLAGFRLFDSATKFVIDPTAVNLNDIQVMIGDTRYATGNGVIKLTDAIDVDFRAEPDGLRLLDLLEALGVDFNLVDTAIQSPNLRIHGTGSPLNLNIGATGHFSDVSLPEHPYDKSKFPISPQCRFDFHLLVSSAQLDFNGTRGLCFQTATADATPVRAGVIEAPRGAALVSPIDFGGQVVFGRGIDLAVRSEAVELGLGQYFAQIPLAGRGVAETRIHGPFANVVIDNRLDAQGVQVLGMPLGTVAGGVSVVGSELKWRDLAVQPESGGSIAVKSGGLTLADPMIFSAQIEGGGIQPTLLAKLFDAVAPDLRLSFGIQSLDANVTGPLLHPLAMKGRVRVTAKDVMLGEERLADSVFTTVDASDRGWSTDDLTVSLGDLVVGAKLSHKRHAPFDYEQALAADDTLTALGASPSDGVDLEFGTLEAQGPIAQERENQLAADHLGSLPFVGAKLREIGIEGRIVARGKVSGKAGDLQGTFQGSLERPTVFGSVLSPVNFRGFLDGGKLDVMLDHSGASFEGRLSLDLAKAGVPYEWFFNFNRMDLRALATEVFHGDPRNFVYLTADWRMHGTFGDWWRSTGELEVKDLRGKYVQDIGAQTKTLQFRQETPVTLLFAKDGWHFKDDKDLYLSGRNVQLRLSMQGSKPPERLGIRIESIVDMAIAKEFSQAIDTATGKLRITADITGPVADPDFVVEVTDLKNTPFIAATWAPVTLGLADLRPPLRNVKMRVLFRDGRLVIDSFAADKGSGTVTASGALSLTESATDESRLDIVLNDATVIYPVAFLKSFETQVSGNVSVSGRGAPYKVSGDIVINKARSTKEVDIRDEIIGALRQKSIGTTLVQEKPTVILDLNVRANESINIHNRNLQSVLSTDLAIRGTDIAPSVSGQVEVDKGKFIYKRDFQIIRGLATFDDPVKPDPSLDVLAQSEVDAYRVYIAITGRVSNPTVEFSVDPPTRESGAVISKLEILVLLSRGKLPEENRSTVQETEKAAASEAANLILGQFEEPVEKLFDLSGQNVVRNVYIDMHPSPEGDPVPRLNLPLDLGEDFDIVFRADQTASEVSTEYNVHDNITFSGVVERRRDESDADSENKRAIDANAKVNLKFRFSFE